ncbi:MAG: aspartate ammonia-lyase [Deltaproteobacteria bacterium]|nr:aspartate ammonia-lyase [Deltaproteobacteria bacterium]
MSTVENKILTRLESDQLGQLEIPADALYGIHTLRALDNFKISNRKVNPVLAKAVATVKLAAARTNRNIEKNGENLLKWDGIINACEQLAGGVGLDQIIVDALSGGAGTSINMNVNEVIANITLKDMNLNPGDYDKISPLNHINLHQSTNDVFPTAIKLASIWEIQLLEQSIISLQEEFQKKEKEFSDVVKIGRTEFQDAVLTTLGKTMSAAADAFARDRWRVYKCIERLRVINLGGTAIGTGIGAPKKYIFQICDELRAITGIGFARGENLMDTTQNCDVFVEVSGILKALATSLIKISTDLRILSSGPDSGFGEIIIEAKQAGSSIMPGKVNPVIPEAVTQGAMQVIGNDTVITIAASSGNLEINQFLPLIADNLLTSIQLLTNSVTSLGENCISTLKADKKRCRKNIESGTAIATAIVPVLGYDEVSRLTSKSIKEGIPLIQLVVNETSLSNEDIEKLTTPTAVCKLGY